MVKDNFFDRPVGAAVLFLNNFHHGKHLNDLNRCARLVPDDVRGMASLLARSPEAHDSTAKLVIDTLISWADEAENSES
jgi:hypothetical protein